MGDVNAALVRARNAVATGTGAILTQESVKIAVERWGHFEYAAFTVAADLGAC